MFTINDDRPNNPESELSEKEIVILRCLTEVKIVPDEWSRLWDLAGLNSVESILELRAEDADKLQLAVLLRRRVMVLFHFIKVRLRDGTVRPDFSHFKYGPPPRPPPEADPSQVVPFKAGRYLCTLHTPQSKNRRDDSKYWFYNATRSGCKSCVRFCVQSHGIDKNVRSNTNNYTARAFAEYNNDQVMMDFIDGLP